MEAAVLTLSDYEIERGKPMPSKNHSIIQLNLGAELRANYKKKYRFASEISLELDYWQSTPDLAIFPPMRMDMRHDEIRLTDAPLGVVEILSPAQSMTELTDKAEKYFQYGVKSVWLVIPTLETVAVYSTVEDFQLFKKNKDKVLKDNILNIEISLNEIFE
jgi:Uma2 family endonuclease